jgi:hypothetical protein
VQFDGAFAMEYSSRVARKRVLFENSIVCLVVLFFCCFLTAFVAPRVMGVVFLMPVLVSVLL